MNLAERSGKPFDPEIEVLQVALGLHMEATGSGHGCHSPEEIRQMVRILEERIQHWTPGYSPRFDDAVKEVILAALEEIHNDRSLDL